MMKDHWGLAVGLSRLSLVFFLGALALLVAHRWFFHRDYCQETDAESSLESAG